MAVLDSQTHQRIGTNLMRWWSDARESCAFLKASLAAAVIAADQWAEDNQVSYNAALPQPFRTQATTTQKALLLVVVILARAGLLRLFRGEDGD